MRLFPKLALSLSALGVAATLGLGISYWILEERSIRRQAELERRAILMNLVHIAQESFLTGDDLLLVKYTRWLQKWNPSLRHASVSDREGQILAHSSPERIGTPDIPEPSKAELLVLGEPVRMGGEAVAKVSLAFSEVAFREELARRLALLQRRVLGAAAVALAGALILAFVIAYSWSRRIRRLARAAERVGEGRFDLDPRDADASQDEIGLLSRAFQTMAARLRELDTLKEEFVSAVTHELRSPLGAIESYVNLMQDEHRKGLGAQAWPEYLGRIRGNTARLNRFVSDLLDVAAIERGKIELKLEHVPLRRILDEVVSLYSAQAAERRIALSLAVPPDLPDVVADSEKIRQVLINFVSNALKFTPQGGAVRVETAASPSGQGLRLLVHDTGIGISPDDQKKIFCKFEQVRTARVSARGPKGTGLGLAISKALVELHGGRLGVDSRPGEGSTFWFEIPLKRRVISAARMLNLR